MTEQQRYDVIGAHGPLELRRYPRCVVADVVVEGSLTSAGNTAFGSLAGYISGRNEGRDKLAMTAPVVQEPAGERSWTVSFVLPGERPLADYPEPADPRVRLREVPEHVAAALGWSGRWTDGNVAKRTAELLADVADAGWSAVGEPRWARYDPPWKPAFARRNEILVSVIAY